MGRVTKRCEQCGGIIQGSARIVIDNKYWCSDGCGHKAGVKKKEIVLIKRSKRIGPVFQGTGRKAKGDHTPGLAGAI